MAKAKVIITQNEKIERAVEEALGYIKNLNGFVKGKRVAVKPNDTWASREDKTAITQPETLRAVLRYLKKYHPSELIVSGGAGAAETDKVFKIGGLMDVIKQEKVTFFDHNRKPFVEVQLDHGPQKSVMVNPKVLEYDSLVVLSQLKVHETATVTLALKNIAMSFPAADFYGHPRSRQYHKHTFFADMHAFIVAMAKRFPIDLAITVAHPAMVGTGPIGGKVVEAGLVIASTDAVAADAAGAQILGFTAQAVRHLYEAGQVGLGETDISKMEFPAISLEEALADFSEKAYGKKISLEHP